MKRAKSSKLGRSAGQSSKGATVLLGQDRAVDANLVGEVGQVGQRTSCISVAEAATGL